ncbi:MAG: hypothetical protein M5U26_05550 [Planctomycetota bacterium]|nr:hypothetical protein [Planctomycetota bacterium]
MSAADELAPAALAAPLPEAPGGPKLPFAGFKHWAGLAGGATAGLLALLVAYADPRTPALAVGICSLGALDAYLLSLVNRNLAGSILACIGGFLIGLVGVGLPALLADPAGGEADLEHRILVPALLVLAPVLVGSGPLALTMLFQRDRPRGFLMRLLLGTVAGVMAALSGLVVYGMLDSVFDALPDGAILVLAFVAANYVLFRLQLLCLLEATRGDDVQRPGFVEAEAGDGRAPEPSLLADPRPDAERPDDEP